jgi:hypothetical protein
MTRRTILCEERISILAANQIGIDENENLRSSFEIRDLLCEEISIELSVKSLVDIDRTQRPFSGDCVVEVD